MELTNEEKCTYCREYGNLPCDECEKKLEEKKAMSKTKFTKVAVSERLPSESGNYFVWVDNPNSRSKDKPEDYNMDKKQFDIFDNEFKSFYEVTHWLEESPDREDEMIEMLERTFNLCDKLQFPTEKQLSDLKTEIKSLLQSLKQEK